MKLLDLWESSLTSRSASGPEKGQQARGEVRSDKTWKDWFKDIIDRTWLEYATRDRWLNPSDRKAIRAEAAYLGVLNKIIRRLNFWDSSKTRPVWFEDFMGVDEVEHHGFRPVIKPNPRNGKREEVLHEQFERFDAIERIYKERYKIERSFAWEDSYRRLVIRYERLKETHEGFKLLAYSMINLRWFIRSK